MKHEAMVRVVGEGGAGVHMKLTTQERQILATVALSHAPECDCETVCRRLREDREASK